MEKTPGVRKYGTGRYMKEMENFCYLQYFELDLSY